MISSTLPQQGKHYILLTLSHRIDGEGFFTGGKDAKIFKVDLFGNPVMLYEGHESAVNSLSQSVKEEFVSGSWDGYILF